MASHGPPPLEHDLRILVLDVGTTGTRAVLFDLSGAVYGMVYQEYQSHFLTPTTINHDPATWLDAVHQVIPAVLRQAQTDRNQVYAIAVTSQRATIVPVGATGQPLAPAILWQDKRTTQECADIEATVGGRAVYQTTGLRIDPYFSLPKLLWYQRHQPEVFAGAYRFLTVHDLVVHHLTGVFATDFTQASRTMLFDIHRLEWTQDLGRAVGLAQVPFPDAYATGTVVGGLSAAAAAHLGLPSGVPVVMAGGDQQCATVGLGVIQPGLAQVTIGTGAFIVTPAAKPVLDPEQRVLCSVSAVPGQWIIEAGVFAAGAVFRWMRDELSKDLTKLARTDGRDVYDLLDEEAAKSLPGAAGLLVLPHLAGSAAPYWDPNARGVIFNLALGHSRSHLFRATLEGIALEVNKNLTVIESLLRDNGVLEKSGSAAVLHEVRVSGGAVRSDLFNRIQADVYGRRVVPGRMAEASALGAAVLAAVAMGAYPNLQKAVETMTGVDVARAVEPDSAVTAVYGELMQVHENVYRALKNAGVYELAAKLAQD
ncbi:MAG: FGGY-family carbohydrate kinase [Bacilli bacterium]